MINVYLFKRLENKYFQLKLLVLIFFKQSTDGATSKSGLTVPNRGDDIASSLCIALCCLPFASLLTVLTEYTLVLQNFFGCFTSDSTMTEVED